MLDAIITRVINFNKRACKGALGTIPLRLTEVRTENLNNAEALLIRGILEMDAQIKTLITAKITAIEDLYLNHGSERAKKTISMRRIVMNKVANLETLTKEEDQFLEDDMGKWRRGRGVYGL